MANPMVSQPQPQEMPEPPKRKTFKNRIYNARNAMRQFFIKRGYILDKAKNKVAALSEQASNIREDATAVAGLNIFAAAGVASTAAAAAAGATVVGLPVAVGLLALSMAISNVMTLVAQNEEFTANLSIIHHEVDRFQKIAKVLQVIAKEHGFELNSGSVNFFVNKLTEYIIYMATPDVIKVINQYKQSVEDNVVFKETGWLESLERRRRRMLAPGECLRQLVRDITILTVFMTIMIGEFLIFYEATTPPVKKQWVLTPEYRAVLLDTFRLAGVPPPAVGEAADKYRERQMEKFQEKLGTFSSFYSPIIQNPKELSSFLRTMPNTFSVQLPQDDTRDHQLAIQLLKKTKEGVEKKIKEEVNEKAKEIQIAISEGLQSQILEIEEKVQEKLDILKATAEANVVAEENRSRTESNTTSDPGPGSPGMGGGKRNQTRKSKRVSRRKIRQAYN